MSFLDYLQHQTKDTQSRQSRLQHDAVQDAIKPTPPSADAVVPDAPEKIASTVVPAVTKPVPAVISAPAVPAVVPAPKQSQDAQVQTPSQQPLTIYMLESADLNDQFRINSAVQPAPPSADAAVPDTDEQIAPPVVSAAVRAAPEKAAPPAVPAVVPAAGQETPPPTVQAAVPDPKPSQDAQTPSQQPLTIYMLESADLDDQFRMMSAVKPTPPSADAAVPDADEKIASTVVPAVTEPAPPVVSAAVRAAPEKAAPPAVPAVVPSAAQETPPPTVQAAVPDPKQSQDAQTPSRKPLTIYMLESADMDDQFRMLYEYIFPLVEKIHPEDAKRLTWLVIQGENNFDLIDMIAYPERLRYKLDQVVAMLRAREAGVNASLPPTKSLKRRRKKNKKQSSIYCFGNFN